jgi:hypothetical protein
MRTIRRFLGEPALGCPAVRVMRCRRIVGLLDATLVVVLGVVVGMSPRQRSGHVLVALW